jgi:AbrB family looped-hinge helix DNA binding protein
MDTVKVSRKFQVVIPKKFREPLHLKLAAVLHVSVYGGGPSGSARFVHSSTFAESPRA